MTAALVTTVIALAAGAPLAMLIDPRERHLDLRWIAEAYLFGIGLQFAALFGLSLIGIAWSPWSAIGVVAGVALIAAAFVSRQGRWTVVRPAFNPIDLATLILFGGYARLATIATPIEADHIGIWGVKGAKFYAARGIDWNFLQQPFNLFSHVDYPLLVPLAYDFQSLIAGEWIGRWAGALNVGCGVATLLVLRHFLAREMNALPAALFTFAFMPLAVSPYIGIAEGAIIAFGTAALFEARNGAITRAAVLLGLAASCKNEGLTLIVAAALALAASGAARALPRLWPAVAIPLPWLVVSRMHGLHGDLTQGSVVARALDHLAHPMPLIRAFADNPPGRPLVWIGIIVALLLSARRIARDERFLALAVVLQFLAFVAAYLVTPREIAWHVRWSWERLVLQLSPSIAFLACVRLKATR